MTLDQQHRAIAKLFHSPYGPDAMQAILEHAGAFEAPETVTGEEALVDRGKRGLAFDIAMMAGLMPVVPGATPESDRAPGEEQSDHAEGRDG